MTLFYVEEHSAWKLKLSKRGCLVSNKGREALSRGKKLLPASSERLSAVSVAELIRRQGVQWREYQVSVQREGTDGGLAVSAIKQERLLIPPAAISVRLEALLIFSKGHPAFVGALALFSSFAGPAAWGGIVCGSGNFGERIDRERLGGCFLEIV